MSGNACVAKEAQARSEFPPNGDAGIAEHRVQQDQPLLLPVLADITDAVLMQCFGHGADMHRPATDADLAGGMP